MKGSVFAHPHTTGGRGGGVFWTAMQGSVFAHPHTTGGRGGAVVWTHGTGLFNQFSLDFIIFYHITHDLPQGSALPPL